MLRLLKRYKIFFLVMFVFSVVTITLFYNKLKPEYALKKFSPADVNPELVDSTIQHVGRAHTVRDFSFTNQNGQTVTQDDYNDKIYIADFFFTTCKSICPMMTNNMALLQAEFKENPNVKLLSHTVMPEVDSVPVLKKYALEKGVVDSKWNLVTGDKKEIYDMARKSYLVVKIGKPEEANDMVHTENFVLVDRKRRIRGFYDGTDPEAMKKLIFDVNFLLTE